MKVMKNASKIAAGGLVFVLGALGAVGGLMLCITIIGIVPGILMMVGGGFGMYYGLSIMGAGTVLRRISARGQARIPAAGARK
jgi:hypothetical protein